METIHIAAHRIRDTSRRPAMEAVRLDQSTTSASLGRPCPAMTSAETMPDPLVPAEADLRAYPTMPLDVRRLRDSRLADHPNPEVFRTSVLLWAAAWHQVPCGSLPNDERELAKLAGWGRSPELWASVRDEVMSAFVLCSDGRFYHDTLSEIVCESWSKRRAYVGRAKVANDAKSAGAKRRKRKTVQSTIPDDSLKVPPVGQKERKGTEGKKTLANARDGAGKPDASAPRVKAPRGSRLPIGWFATPKDRAYAAAKGFDDPEIDRIEDEFRTWWPAQPGSRGVKLDWNLTWMTWVQREEKRRGRHTRAANGTGPGRGGVHDTDRLGALHRAGLAAVGRRRA